MTQIKVQVLGLERVTRVLTGDIPRDARDGVSRVVKTLGLQLQRKVVQEKLAGQVLNRRSGRLARSINTKFTTDGDTFTSSTGTNLSYGRFWELGFSGIQQVQAHTRHVKSRDILYGRTSKKQRKAALLANYGSAMGVAFVDAHVRLVNQPPRSFLRSSLADMRPQIVTELQKAVSGLYTG